MNKRLSETINAITSLEPLKESMKEVKDILESGSSDRFKEAVSSATYEDILNHCGLTETELSREQFNAVAQFIKCLQNPNQVSKYLRFIDICGEAII